MPATTGIGRPSNCLNRSRYSASFGGPENSAISAPEKKVRPSQTNTTARMPVRARMSAIAANSPARTAALIVFTGGLSTLMTATSASTLVVTIFALMQDSSTAAESPSIPCYALPLVSGARTALPGLRAAGQPDQTIEQPQELRPPFRSDLRDEARLVHGLQLRGLLQHRAPPRREPERVATTVRIGIAAPHQPPCLKIRDGGDEVRLLDAERRRDARLAGPRILVDQQQHGELRRAQVEFRQSVDEIGRNDDLCAAQRIADVAAEWRQFHRPLLALHAPLTPHSLSYCRRASTKTRRRAT